MSAPLSIVVPTLNAESTLPACLGALVEGVTAGLVRELVVTDGGSEDATNLIAEDAGAQWISGPPSRGGQLRRGVQCAQGPWVLVLHADTVLPAGWSVIVGEHIEARHHPAYFKLAFRERGLMPAWVAAWANLRSRVFALPYGDQGLLLPKCVYDRVGGYPDAPLMEDVALVRALGRPLAELPIVATTSADRYKRTGWFRRGTRNLWILTRYLFGADPETLSAAYRR